MSHVEFKKCSMSCSLFFPAARLCVACGFFLCSLLKWLTAVITGFLVSPLIIRYMFSYAMVAYKNQYQVIKSLIHNIRYE